jgi:hypothetical protein
MPQRDFMLEQRNQGIVRALFRERASNLHGAVPIRVAGWQSAISAKTAL